MSTDPGNPEPSEQLSGLMKLPVEVRCIIYELALQDTVDFITSTTTDSKCAPIKLRGALALLHTSRVIRAESSDEMLALTMAHHETAKATLDFKSAGYSAACRGRKVSPLARDHLFSEMIKARYIVSALGMLEFAMWRCGNNLQGDSAAELF